MKEYIKNVIILICIHQVSIQMYLIEVSKNQNYITGLKTDERLLRRSEIGSEKIKNASTSTKESTNKIKKILLSHQLVLMSLKQFIKRWIFKLYLWYLIFLKL